MQLTFDAVDDLAFAVVRKIRVDAHVTKLSPEHLGPCLEYLWLRRSFPLPSLRHAPQTPVLEILQRFVEAGAPISSDLTLTRGRDVEISRVPETPGSPQWIAFLRRVQCAAAARGHNSSVAAGFAGAVGEMAANAIEHSMRPSSALMGYRTGADGFEFVVADCGIGLRASLQQCAEFRCLSDPAEALTLCIQEGISRHGVGIGRGLGFAEVFRSLANLNALVRLRTENQALAIEGRSVGPLAGVPTERPFVPGFLISIHVEPQGVGATT